MQTLGDVIKAALKCFHQRTVHLLQLRGCLCRLTTWQSFHVPNHSVFKEWRWVGRTEQFIFAAFSFIIILLSHMALPQLIKIRDHISPESLGWKAKYNLCSIYIRVFKIIMAINLTETPKPNRNDLLQSRNYHLLFFFASSPWNYRHLTNIWIFSIIRSACKIVSVNTHCLQPMYLCLVSSREWPVFSRRSSALFYFPT